MSERRFRAAWDQYAAKVLPAGAGFVQTQETRRAFYAGGISLLGTIMAMLDPGVEPTEGDLRKMDALKQEFDEYARDLAEGKA